MDNNHPNNVFPELKLLKTVAYDRISNYKTYQGHIEPFSVPRALESPNLGKFRAEIHEKKAKWTILIQIMHFDGSSSSKVF